MAETPAQVAEKLILKHMLRPEQSKLSSTFLVNGGCAMCGVPITDETVRQRIQPMIAELTTALRTAEARGAEDGIKTAARIFPEMLKDWDARRRANAATEEGR